ncbi:iron-hydroxamate transporter permease subunit [Citrobacter freundii]|nr:iron-hydroxamate transporter permease subunit [Citrobacter freundii]
MSKRIALFPILLLAVLFVAACWLTWVNFSVALPRSQWQQAIWSPDIDDIKQMVFHYSLLPRLAISLLVGAGLGLVGVLFQQVLRNPTGGANYARRCDRCAVGHYRHDAVGYSRCALHAICCAGRCLCRWGAGVWRRLGANVFLR